MNVDAAPHASRDLGLGTAYERVAIYRLFERWSAGLRIETACEGPVDGVTGMPGLHLLGFAHHGIPVTVCHPDDDALARVRALYRRQGVDHLLSTKRLPADATPTGPFDVLVSFNALPYAEDWRDSLEDLFRADARWLFIVLTNPASYGTHLRRAQRTVRNEATVELFDHESTRPGIIEPELARHGRVVAHDYFDCPWWPNFYRRDREAGPDDGAASRFTFDAEHFPFFEDQPRYAETMRALRMQPAFDRAPARVARIFAHLHGYLVERKV
jgi:hypothetical protein